MHSRGWTQWGSKVMRDGIPRVCPIGMASDGADPEVDSDVAEVAMGEAAGRAEER